MISDFEIQSPSDNRAFWEEKAKHKRYLHHLSNRSYARVNARDDIVRLIRDGARSIVEVGVGGGYERIALDGVIKSKGVKYTGVDLALGFVQRGRQKFPNDNWVQADITRDPLIEADIVYSQHVLEHCPGLSPALDWMLQSARKALVYVFFIPPGETQEIRRRHRGWLFSNRYAERAVEALCVDLGFSCTIEHFDNRPMSLNRHAANDEALLYAERFQTC